MTGMRSRRAAGTAKLLLTAASLSLSMMVAATAARADGGCPGPLKEEYCDLEQREFLANDPNGAFSLTPPQINAGQVVPLSFEGITQYDTAALGRNFIPPDTMGAVGTTQFMETSNGAYAVYDKATGNRTLLQSDVQWWANAGQTGANGDSRVMFNSQFNRWIVLSFGASTSDIQIAVSQTADALGPWQSTKFTGFAGGTADYPTLAMDKNAVYIGTNNFAPSFQGTTLNVIPLTSLFNAGAPTTTGLKQFVTPYTGGAGDDLTRGFAIQGVNSTANTTTGKILAVSLTTSGLDYYKVNNAGTPGATETPSQHIADLYDGNGPGRQPSLINPRVIDTLDDRVGSSVYEVNGRIYSVHTVTPTGTNFTAVRYDVIDATTGAVLDQGDIWDGQHDFYEGSLAVNANGDVVIGFNRSGSVPGDGKIKVMAQLFKTSNTGQLQAVGGNILLKDSLTDDYHNGSLDGQPAAGRQRWGDYSAVSLDPTDPTKFWVIGEFAREPNTPAAGHPGGTGGTRWGTWIAEIDFSAAVAGVPEPAVWAQMILGFGLIGGLMRRRSIKVSYAA